MILNLLYSQGAERTGRLQQLYMLLHHVLNQPPSWQIICVIEFDTNSKTAPGLKDTHCHVYCLITK